MIVKGTETSIEPEIPAGIHEAACVFLAHIGTQPKTWEGRDYTVPQVIVGFECQQIEGHPRTSLWSSFSLKKKSQLRKQLESWRGKPFTEEELAGWDLEQIVGKPCQIQVIHRENAAGYKNARIENVLPAVKGQSKATTTKPIVWSVADALADSSRWQDVPEWIQDAAKRSIEYTQTAAAPEASRSKPDEPEDDIPF